LVKEGVPDDVLMNYPDLGVKHLLVRVLVVELYDSTQIEFDLGQIHSVPFDVIFVSVESQV